MLSFGQLERLQAPLSFDGSWKRYEINEKSRNALFCYNDKDRLDRKEVNKYVI